MEVIQRLNEDLGFTVVFVTHEPAIAEYARRILRVRDDYLGACASSRFHGAVVQ